HMAYSAGLHVQYKDPWDYAFVQGQLVVRARHCQQPDHNELSCALCKQLSSGSWLIEICHHMKNGVHDNAPLAYHSHGGLVNIIKKRNTELHTLHLQKLNDAHKLAGKVHLLDVFEQFVIAVGSGKVEHIDRLV
ncbi:hypothetical protein BDQ17DRAFT_1265189, partial [Cyathus striatus]